LIRNYSCACLSLSGRVGSCPDENMMPVSWSDFFFFILIALGHNKLILWMTDFFAEKVKRASEVKFKILLKFIFLKCIKVKRAIKKKKSLENPFGVGLSSHKLQSGPTIVMLLHTNCKLQSAPLLYSMFPLINC
jgi:hypothetical protein